MKLHNNNVDPANQDEMPRKFLEPLQELRPPDELRERLRLEITRAAVGKFHSSEASSRSSNTASNPPLWKRKISISMPAAAVFATAFILMTGVTIMGQIRKEATIPNQATKPDFADAAVPASRHTPHPQPHFRYAQAPEPPVVDTPQDCTPVHRRESVVIAGLGSIQTEIYMSCERKEQ